MKMRHRIFMLLIVLTIVFAVGLIVGIIVAVVVVIILIVVLVIYHKNRETAGKSNGMQFSIFRGSRHSSTVGIEAEGQENKTYVTHEV